MKKVICKKCGKERFVTRQHGWAIRIKKSSGLCRSCSYKGRILSKEHRLKIANSLKGRIGWNKGRIGYKAGELHYNWKGGKPKCRICKKNIISYTSKLCMDCFHKEQLGKPRSLWIREKISKSRKRGPDSHFWRGGVCAENMIIRKSFRYKLWREKVFGRDNFTCIFCGKHDDTLNADHIKPFSLFPKLRFDLSNGRTLCLECHRKTETYGKNIYTDSQLDSVTRV